MYYNFRKEATSGLAGFHASALSWSNWNLEMLVFEHGGKKTGARLETVIKSTHTGGRRALSTLRHPCFPNVTT